MGNKTLIFAALCAMVGGIGVASYFNQTEKTVTTRDVIGQPDFQGFALNPEKFIAMPPLQKDDGSLFTNDDLKNHWSLLFFGYTNCPDICPMTMNVLAQSALLASKEGMSFPEVFFISVDPQRDSVEMLGEYVRYFDSSFTGVTGEAKMIEALTLQAGVVFMKVPSSSGNKDDYLVDHSASILLINPDGKLTAYLRPPHSSKSILKSIKTLMN